jgi:glycosyltransferase involved in cell wall biosynthesis
VNAPTASILVPVLNEARWLRQTAAAVADQQVDGGIEVLFIDGGSHDGSREILARLAAGDPRIRVLDNPDRVIPAALNCGLHAARGAYVARMDAHTIYPRDYVARGITRLRRGDVEWVTGPAVPGAESGFARCVAAALGSSLGQGGSSKWSPGGAGPEEIELDTGVFAGVWPRATLERLGGWHPDFHVNEDAEMAARVLDAGGRIVCLSAMAAHYAPRGTARGLWRQYWRFGRYRALTARRHPVALRRAHLASAGLAAMVAATVAPARALAWPARAGAAAYAAAIGVAAARVAPTRRDIAGVALALATMHLSWGSGFIYGCARSGPPIAGLRRLLARGSRQAAAAR